MHYEFRGEKKNYCVPLSTISFMCLSFPQGFHVGYPRCFVVFLSSFFFNGAFFTASYLFGEMVLGLFSYVSHKVPQQLFGLLTFILNSSPRTSFTSTIPVLLLLFGVLFYFYSVFAPRPKESGKGWGGMGGCSEIDPSQFSSKFSRLCLPLIAGPCPQ